MNHKIISERAVTLVCQALCALLIGLLSNTAAAQAPQLYVYPLKQQSSEQQDRDRYECHSWATRQTGFDPSRAYPSNPTYLDPQPYRPSQPHVLRGAGRGAALGAVGGAIGATPAGELLRALLWAALREGFAEETRGGNRRLSSRLSRQMPPRLPLLST
jgi:hypothetical protein